MLTRSLWFVVAVLCLTGSAVPAADNPSEWIMLFNGTDLSGWKVKH